MYVCVIYKFEKVLDPNRFWTWIHIIIVGRVLVTRRKIRVFSFLLISRKGFILFFFFFFFRVTLTLPNTHHSTDGGGFHVCKFRRTCFKEITMQL